MDFGDFYVGKGTGNRAQHHVKDVLQLLGNNAAPRLVVDSKVYRWLTSPNMLSSHLLPAIPDRGGSVVRYVWEIKWSDMYGRSIRPALGSTFRKAVAGVPLGPRDHDFSALGRVLTESRGDRTVQVLAGYAAGWRELTV